MRGSLNVTLFGGVSRRANGIFIKAREKKWDASPPPAAFSPLGVRTVTASTVPDKEASGRQGRGEDVVLTERSSNKAAAWEARQRSREDERKQRDH